MAVCVVGAARTFPQDQAWRSLKRNLVEAFGGIGLAGGGPAAFPNFAGGGGGPADLPGPRFFSVGVVGEPGGDGSDLKKKAERVPDQNTLN